MNQTTITYTDLSPAERELYLAAAQKLLDEPVEHEAETPAASPT